MIVATGPLTSPALAAELAALTGSEHLYFYDAMAPIVTVESVDMAVAFRASRYGRGQEEGDYLNCPMSQAEYERFWEALVGAETIPLRDFEQQDARFFEACLPVEVLARRGQQALAFGPLKPVGLADPRTGRRPYAVVQLRQDNQAATLYNLVGFQTNLKWSEQERVFRLIPGLERAEFVRFGQMHRNTFINSPSLLRPTMQFRDKEGLFFAGQITGTEGYVGSAASGYVAGLNAARLAAGQTLVSFPSTTMIGALCQYVCNTQRRRLSADEGQLRAVAAARSSGASQTRAVRRLGASRSGRPGAVREGDRHLEPVPRRRNRKHKVTVDRSLLFHAFRASIYWFGPGMDVLGHLTNLPVVIYCREYLTNGLKVRLHHQKSLLSRR